MHSGHETWVELLNAETEWLTDADMLRSIPVDARHFDGSEDWPRAKALAYLSNNVAMLRDHYRHLEAGRPVDLDLLNPVLETCRPRLVDAGRADRRDVLFRRARDGRRPDLFLPALQAEGFNPATAHLRWLVQRAYWHFAHYAQMRWSDPAYPGSTPGMLRVLPAPASEGEAPRLVICPAGLPAV